MKAQPTKITVDCLEHGNNNSILLDFDIMDFTLRFKIHPVVYSWTLDDTPTLYSKSQNVKICSAPS
jgi:hypothetical protein